MMFRKTAYMRARDEFQKAKAEVADIQAQLSRLCGAPTTLEGSGTSCASAPGDRSPVSASADGGAFAVRCCGSFDSSPLGFSGT